MSEEEIARVCGHWAKQGEPDFDEELLEAREPEPEEGAEGELSPDEDDLLAFFGGRPQPVVAHLVETGKLTLDDVQEAEQLIRRLSKKEKSR